MPRIFEFGLPGFNFGRPDTCAVESLRFPVRGNHALIKGCNGVGKTASVIDPFLYLLKLHVKTERKTRIARYMREHNARLPYIYYVDMLIDGQDVDPDMDMVLAGYFIDNTRLGKSDDPSEYGFHFIVRHSSRIWTEIDDDRPVYEKLGLPFVLHDPNRYELKKINDTEAMRKILSRDTETMRARTYAITGGKTKPEFLKDLSEATRYDFQSALVQAVELSTSEGGSSLKDLKEADLLDKFLFAPIENDLLPYEKQSKLLGMLTKSCEDDLDAGLRQRQIAQLERAESGLQEIAAQAQRAESAKKAFEEETGRLRRLANALQAGEESKSARIGEIGAALEENAQACREAKRHAESAVYRTEQSELRGLAETKENTAAARAAAEEHAVAADLAVRRARAAAALEKERRAKAELASYDKSIEQFKADNGFGEENDIDFTLHLLNDEKTEECRAAVSQARLEYEVAQRAFDDAAMAVADATAKNEGAKSVLFHEEDRFKRALAVAGEKLAKAGIENAVNAFGFADWDAAEEKRGNEKACEEKARRTAEQAEAEALDARSAIDAAQKEVRELSREQDRVDAAACAAHEKLIELEKKMDEMAARHPGLARLSSRAACEDATTQIETDIAELAPITSQAHAAVRKAEEKLDAAERGTLMLPEGAFEVLEAAGVKAQPATAYMADMAEAVREDLLKRVPAAAACVVVDDGSFELALRALSRDGDEWFAGAVGVLKHSEISNPATIAEGRFAAHPDAEYIADSEGRIEQLADEAAGLRTEASRLEREEFAARDAKAEVRAFSARWYEGPFADDDAYRAAYATAAEKARGAAAALAAASDRETALRERLSAIESSLDEAKKDAEKHAALVRRIDDALALRAGLDDARNSLEKARAKKRKSELALDETKKTRQTCAEDKAAKESARAGRERELRNTEERLLAIPRPASGSRLENREFDELYTQRAFLHRRLNEQQPVLDELERRRDEAAERALECGRISNMAVSELEEEEELPEPRAVLEEEIYRLAQTAEARKTDAVAAKAKDDAAAERLSAKQRTVQRLLENFQLEYRGDPLPSEKIMPSPQQKLRELAREENELENAKRKLDGVRRLFSESLTKLIRKGSTHLAVTPDANGEKEDIDEVAADELSALVDKRVGDLLSASESRMSADRYLAGALNRHNAALGTGDATLAVALVNPRKENAPSKEEVESALQATKGALVSLRSADDDARITRASLVTEIDGIGKSAVSHLRLVQSRGNDEFRFIKLGGGHELSGEEQYQDIDNWLASAIAEAGKLARVKEDIAARKECIEGYFRGNVLNVKNITARRLDVASTAFESGFIKIRSPRALDNGKFIFWKDLKNPSGGEKLSARLRVIAALMSSNGMDKQVTSIMMVDTMFGGLSAEDLIDPVFQVLKKSRIQLIVVEDRIDDPHINARFPHISTIRNGVLASARVSVSAEEKTGKDNMVAFFTATGRSTQEALF